jgi:type I restriction enzyme S subunit
LSNYDILKEQRTAIINQAVTKGLNPDVKLKDSGIEWLGEIPEHWDVKKLKYLAVNERYSFVDGPFGSDLKNEEYTDTGVPLIQLNNIGIGEHIIRNLKFISKEKAEQLYKHKVLPNDIIIAKMAEPVARSAKVKPDFKEYVVVADCMKFRPALDTINVDFLVYTLNRGYVTAQAEVQSTGTTRIRIGLTDAKKLKVVVPPIEEQNYIVDNLDENIKKIDKTVKKRGRQIDLLKEYRTALISEVVTGKIDVRDSGIQAVIHS